MRWLLMAMGFMLAVVCDESVTAAKEIYRSSAVTCSGSSSVKAMTVAVVRNILSFTHSEGAAQITLTLTNGTKRYFKIQGVANQTNTKIPSAGVVGRYVAHGVSCMVRHQNIIAILCTTGVRGGTCSVGLKFWGKEFFYTLKFSITPVRYAGPS